jgi:hypothetical protein
MADARVKRSGITRPEPSQGDSDPGLAPSDSIGLNGQQQDNTAERDSSPGLEVPRGPASWHAAAAARRVPTIEPSLLEVNLHEDDSGSTWQEQQQSDAGGAIAVSSSLLPQVERLQQQLAVEKQAREVRPIW